MNMQIFSNIIYCQVYQALVCVMSWSQNLSCCTGIVGLMCCKYTFVLVKETLWYTCVTCPYSSLWDGGTSLWASLNSSYCYGCYTYYSACALGAVCPVDEWQELISGLDYDSIRLRDARYDQVVHMMTAAKGAEPFYQLDNNATRSEGLELARELDTKAALVHT